MTPPPRIAGIPGFPATPLSRRPTSCVPACGVLCACLPQTFSLDLHVFFPKPLPSLGSCHPLLCPAPPPSRSARGIPGRAGPGRAGAVRAVRAGTPEARLLPERFSPSFHLGRSPRPSGGDGKRREQTKSAYKAPDESFFGVLIFTFCKKLRSDGSPYAGQPLASPL